MILLFFSLKEVSTKVSLILITFVWILTLSLFIPFSAIRRARISLNIVMGTINSPLDADFVVKSVSNSKPIYDKYDNQK